MWTTVACESMCNAKPVPENVIELPDPAAQVLASGEWEPSPSTEVCPGGGVTPAGRDGLDAGPGDMAHPIAC
jgi:hypothetical protein